MIGLDGRKKTPNSKRTRFTDLEKGVKHNDSYSNSGSISNYSPNVPRSHGRSSMHPSTVFPIHYRTLSHLIEETKFKASRIEELKKAKEETAAELAQLEWPVLSFDELSHRLETSITDGLLPEQVKQRLAHYGRNMPSSPPSQWMRKFFGYLFGGFGSILLTGSVLVFVSWKPLGQPPDPANLALGIVLLIVFFIQAGFNAWQDWSSSRVMASITTMLPDHCNVQRGGQEVEVLAPEVVPGDMLFIKAGNKLPADVRFVTVSSDAKFDRSMLTGESKPLSGSVDRTDANYLETRNIGMQGAYCVSGSAVGVVVATGDNTVFGRIAQLTNKPNTSMTPLQKEILNFVLLIVGLMLVMIIIVVIVWTVYLRKHHPDWINVPGLIVVCVSVAIAFVPEGLPIALTASLTITAGIMKRNSILCKSLKTVETLGAVSIICSDKTGTLTKNQMYASDYAIDSKTMTSASARVEVGTDIQPLHNSSLEQLRTVAGLCNAGEFDETTVHLPVLERKVDADATDQALFRFSESLGPISELRRMWTKRFDLAFNSQNKFMIRVFSLAEKEGLYLTLPPLAVPKYNQEKDLLLLIKGGPDVLMDRCTSYISADGSSCILDEKTRASQEEIKDSWSRQGKRVILLAHKILVQEEIINDPASNAFEREAMAHAMSDLTLVGLIAIEDPPKEEIPNVVRVLRRAGIRLFMVTGDFKLTAQAIAFECGIITNPPSLVHSMSDLSIEEPKPPTAHSSGDTSPSSEKASLTSIVISGPELIHLNENQWTHLCTYTEIVFARTTPEQKLRIVKELQARSHIVGMTGDGVNDAPSLQKADIGIAIGTGSDIAIEAADMVLLDSFSAIVSAVQYGRVVFDNLKKTIIYLIPAGTFSELWPVMTFVIFGLPQILSSFLMIIICCFTDCAAATVLAYEKPEADVLLRPPRDLKKDRLVDWKLLLNAYGFFGILECAASFAMSYWYLQTKGIPFSSLWFGYGNLPPGISQEYLKKTENEASSIYFVNLVVMQWFTLLSIRTRHLSILTHPPLFNKRTQNLYLFPTILFAFICAIIFLYIPRIQNAVNTATIPWEHWFLPMAFGVGILGLDEGRKWACRRWPDGWVKACAW